jgi:hypothetical protein
MKKNFNNVVNWWNDKKIKLVNINGAVYALNGWNGERYYNCWKCTGEFLMDASKEKYVITPIYEEQTEDVFELIGYEIENM